MRNRYATMAPGKTKPRRSGGGARKRYFAVVKGNTGYALDYYPTEKAKYIKELGTKIIGDFSSIGGAHSAIERHFETSKWRLRTEPSSHGY